MCGGLEPPPVFLAGKSHISVVPLAATIGNEPSSQPGSEPSLQVNESVPVRVGGLPSSHAALAGRAVALRLALRVVFRVTFLAACLAL